MIVLTTVDAHVGGAPVRLITDGAPSPRGTLMRDKTAWMQRHADHLRIMLMHEPRGHRDMTGAMLTEPVSPGSHAGLILMHGDGYAAMAGHAVIATTMLALTHGLLMPGGDGRTVVYDTVAGTIRARAIGDGGAAPLGRRVAFTNVPSFVLAGGVSVRAAGRLIRADIAFGGAFYAVVDAESLGLSVGPETLPLLRQISRDVCDAVDAMLTVVHPLDATRSGLAGTLFTGPANVSDAHLRNVTVLASGAAGRSASGTGMSAVMAVLDAMGLLGDDDPFVMEGMSGARLVGRVAQRTMVGDVPAVVPEIEGEAWPTGEHRFVADPADPCRLGLTGV